MMMNVGEAYVKATKEIKHGQLYYETGELRYEGDYVEAEGYNEMLCGHGTLYYKSGMKKMEGLFQRRGLVCGRMFYPSGNLKFEGYCKEPSGYGPAYPTTGTFFAEDGTVLYQGTFRIQCGGVGYPRVVEPENFGPLSL